MIMYLSSFPQVEGSVKIVSNQSQALKNSADFFAQLIC